MVMYYNVSETISMYCTQVVWRDWPGVTSRGLKSWFTCWNRPGTQQDSWGKPVV